MAENARVRVRRERPSALSWALALLLTMLCVYLLTLGLAAAPEASIDSGETRRASPRKRPSTRRRPISWPSGALTRPRRRASRRRATRPGARRAMCWKRRTASSCSARSMKTRPRPKASPARSRQSEGLACEVYTERADGARLRITAAEADIALVREAEARLRALAAETRDLALALDRGEDGRRRGAHAAQRGRQPPGRRCSPACETCPARRTTPSPPACWPWRNNSAPPFLCFRAKIQKTLFPFPRKSSIIALTSPWSTCAICANSTPSKTKELVL